MPDGGPARDFVASFRNAEPLGILTCAGPLPLEIARLVTARGRPVHLVALEGFADPGAAAYPHERVGLGQLDRLLRSFRRAGCREIVIAGAMRRPDLLRLRPDLGILKHLPTILSLTRGGDDSVLRRIVRFFENQGFIVRGAGEVAPELLAGAGALGRHAPDAAHCEAIDRAARALAALGDFDIGQAAVATAERVLTIETSRGTDAMLESLAADAGATGAVLVKLAKPGQELRVDLPAIGARTVEAARAAGLAGIAVGAGRTIVLEREAMLAAADAEGLFVAGITTMPPRVAAPPPDMRQLAVMARRAPTPNERGDIGIGRQLLPLLVAEGLGRAAIISRHHVLGVAGAQPVASLIASLGRDASWGRRRFRKQLGVLALDIAWSSDLLTREVFQAAADAHLAGIACLGAPLPRERLLELIGWANDGRLFLLAEEPPEPEEALP